jgi:hypothetical protein
MKDKKKKKNKKNKESLVGLMQPAASSQQSQITATVNLQPGATLEPSRFKSERENMEVHKHPHHILHKKKWHEYLLEFALLFLAVFLGFIAENLREHRVEAERARELANSFYEELKADSGSFRQVMENRDRKNASFIFLKKYFRDSSLEHCSKSFAVNFSYCFATFSPSVFQPKDAILEQLKNSGSLRYFKNEQLQKLIGELAVNITDLRSRNQLELDFTQQHLLPFFVEHNDQDWFDNLGLDSNVFLANRLYRYEMSNEDFPFNFKKPASVDRAAATNMIGLYQIIFRGSLFRQYKEYERLNQQLVDALRREYGMK